MKRAFTLIELMVSVVIVLLISGGALVNLNRFNSRQKLEKAKDEVVAAIKMIQSSARGRQLPAGMPEASASELKYISLFLIGTNNEFLKAQANDIGTTWYFRNLVKNSEIGVSLNPGTIIFWAGTGGLVKNINGLVYGADETAVAIVESNSDITEKYKIIINSMGQIKEVRHEE